MKVLKSTLAIVSAAAVLGVSGFAQAGATLDAVQKKGFVQCGVSDGLPGFSVPDASGKILGIDADFCRAVAAAVFGDATKVKFSQLNAKERFTALQSGEVDILSRNTTWSLSRDATLGGIFLGTWFYDGQGFMVKQSLGVKSAKELNGATVCVQPGTTTELNVSDYFRANKMQFKPVVINDIAQIQQAFFSGRCDVFTTDLSGLAATRRIADKPDDYLILPELISKEPLAPFVRRGDDEWFAIVKWVPNALIEAEEVGITQANIDQLRTSSKDPAQQRLLGTGDDLGKLLGLSKDWSYKAIKAVGNYGEIFERNVGPNSVLKLPRGNNRLWNKGGLVYALPVK